VNSQMGHEKLHVYQQSLEFVSWTESLLAQIDGQATKIGARSARSRDETTTGIVLNVAEGNGRFCHSDHRRFLDISHTCAMNTASRLDMLVAKQHVGVDEIAEGKRILMRLVPLLLGLRGSVTESECSK
jgi:hypothetical protein